MKLLTTGPELVKFLEQEASELGDAAEAAEEIGHLAETVGRGIHGLPTGCVEEVVNLLNTASAYVFVLSICEDSSKVRQAAGAKLLATTLKVSITGTIALILMWMEHHGFVVDDESQSSVGSTLH